MRFSAVAAVLDEQGSTPQRSKLRRILVKRPRKGIFNTRRTQFHRSLYQHHSHPHEGKASGFDRIVKIKQRKRTRKLPGFFDLPGELRNEIYAQLLTAPNELGLAVTAHKSAFEESPSFHWSNTKEVARIYSNLSLTCKQMREEVRFLPMELNNIHLYPVTCKVEDENRDVCTATKDTSDLMCHPIYEGPYRAKGLVFYFSIPDFFSWKVKDGRRIEVKCVKALEDRFSNIFKTCHASPRKKIKVILTYRDLVPLPFCRMEIVVIRMLIEKLLRGFPKNLSIAFHVCWRAELTKLEEVFINRPPQHVNGLQASINKAQLEQSLKKYGAVVEIPEAEFRERHGFHASRRSAGMRDLFKRMAAGRLRAYSFKFV